MIPAPQSPRRRPTGPGRLLLVLAVLAGVLAMHGLGAGGMSAMSVMTERAHAVAAAGHGSGHHQTGEDCSHGADGQGHVHHADATCAATGISTPYAPPALAAALPGAPEAAVFATRAPAPTESGRAPPDLAELQLLRI